jgi:hypothetical protein
MTRAEAKKIAQQHVGKSSEVYVTSDGNVFFAETKSYADYHCRENNVELHEFKDSELNSVTATEIGEDKPKKKGK